MKRSEVKIGQEVYFPTPRQKIMIVSPILSLRKRSALVEYSIQEYIYGIPFGSPKNQQVWIPIRKLSPT